jgi:hypothetical protein
LSGPIPQCSQLSEITPHHPLIGQLYLRLLQLVLNTYSCPPLLLPGTRLVPLDLPVA